ncbi:hypothetical protein [Conexibacter sp. CPCC 206217]|uniref:hypothetical protein n=1 Tax=Conexibacter sp. CPCC 206217 TaxID=3064574 RepID=UPI00271E279F|nr:hypothetical protein [Conexibacter sp. CPCC 206217]MDO8209464.1 hypothetical protein [Conexibacter sp. CPCC 206217]
MTAQQADGWAQRYDRAAGEQVQDVVAAAQFMRPRGWKAFGHALADGPVGLMQRALGRPRQVRLPEAVLVAVSDGSVHLLSARTRPGGGPVPYPTRSLAAWPRADVEVAASPVHDGTRLTIAPHNAPAVELYGPPDALTARVVQALTGSGETQAATAAAANDATARELAATASELAATASGAAAVSAAPVADGEQTSAAAAA